MAMRRESEVQGDLVATWAEMPRSPGQVFYDNLQRLLTGAGFDAFVEATCKPCYAPRMGAPSLAQCPLPGSAPIAARRRTRCGSFG